MGSLRIKLLLLMSQLALINLVNGDAECWVSGCQPYDWAKRGCFPDDEWEQKGGPMPCPGGDKYKCCKKAADSGPKRKDCWTSGCQPFDWAQRGCFPAEEWEKVATYSCPSGNKYKCCTRTGGSSSSSFSSEDTSLSRGNDHPTTARPPDSFGIDTRTRPPPNFRRPAPTSPPRTVTTEAPDEGLSFKQFSDAFTLNRFPAPKPEDYNTMMDYANSIGGISTIKELAMFVTHVIYNSNGLRTKRENCGRRCSSGYRSSCDRVGKSYYGRGYMHLKWCHNYQEASEDLYGDERLLNDPDIVERDDEAAWATALWFWKRSVRTKPGVLDGMFGSSTHRVNREECRGNNNEEARERYQIYTKVLVAFGQSNVRPDERGCYNK